MKDVIEMLLKKQETLEADKEAEKAAACAKIDAEYSERSQKIVTLLDMTGYVPAVEVKADEQTVEPVAEAVEEPATDSEVVAETAPAGQIVY